MRVLRDLHQTRLEITPLHQFRIVAPAAASITLPVFARSSRRAGVAASGVEGSHPSYRWALVAET